MDSQAPLFRMEGVSKSYGGVRALEQADMTISAGRVHAILGENGAGKSTLIKVMAGVVAADGGRMTMEGSAMSPSRRRPRRRPRASPASFRNCR